ncbi:DUF2326 domain-containing protein [Paenibacillus polymyxa]|uniref:DUF2326 domain-containing protein n=1 Tax=Paenibacillus polymyxa TaxID=1406 RepID=UPI0020246023|nr:DUF2326 domain-containing protein [Paenibacillus polymyxa]URJ44114.1 DUF2326 domain-containing protein [Paenibacillus polymyxa]
MKLSKIYCNNQKFKTINFSDGLNIIIGKIINKEDLNSNSHNLGKSTLIGLIDFLFLKELKKGHFLKDNFDKFINHVFFLELKQSEGNYITIKRSVKNNTKISIKLHNSGKQNFIEETNWNYIDLPITSQDKNKNPVQILNKLWGFNKVLPYSYRTYLNYFLRTQYDYEEVFKLSKFRGTDSTWKAPLTRLFGFDGKLIEDKYNLSSEIASEEKLLIEMEKELKISLTDLNKIEALIAVNEKKRDEITSKIDSFDFYLKERELNKELIENVEREISINNSLEYKLNYEVMRIQDSINKQIKYDLSSIEQLFKEIKLMFPHDLKKSYEELIQFNIDITEERNKFLKDNLSTNQVKLDNVRSELETLNHKRNEILSVLQEKDSFAKFKKYQMDLVEIENEISQLLSKIDNIDVLKQKGIYIDKLKGDLSKIILKITAHLKEHSSFFKMIQQYFSDLVKTILDETAILFYSLNKNDNIEFEAKITSLKEDILTSKSEGYSYRKMLCVCFDLAVARAYKDELNFYKFVYHDGSLESLSNTKKVKYIDTVRQICEKDKIQYIFTTLEDDIPRNPDGTFYKIDISEVAVVLDNSANNEGRLFGFSF